VQIYKQMKCKGQKTVLNIPLKDQANAKEIIKYLVSGLLTQYDKQSYSWK